MMLVILHSHLMLFLKSPLPYLSFFCPSTITCHRQTLHVFRNFVASQCIALRVFPYQEFILLRASLITDTFQTPSSIREWTRSARERALFGHAQLVLKRRIKPPCCRNILHSVSKGDGERLYYTSVNLFKILFFNVLCYFYWNFGFWMTYFVL